MIMGFLDSLKSQRGRNEEIFKEVNEVINQFTVTLEGNEDVLAKYRSWYTGAKLLALDLISEVDCFKAKWGKGSKQQALSLLKICMLPMMSTWHMAYSLSPEITMEELERLKRRDIHNMNVMTGVGPPNAVRDFLNMDKQFAYDIDKEDQPYLYLISSRAVDALSLTPPTSIIDWDKQKFPIEDRSTLDLGVLPPQFSRRAVQLLRLKIYIHTETMLRTFSRSARKNDSTSLKGDFSDDEWMDSFMGVYQESIESIVYLVQDSDVSAIRYGDRLFESGMAGHHISCALAQVDKLPKPNSNELMYLRSDFVRLLDNCQKLASARLQVGMQMNERTLAEWATAGRHAQDAVRKIGDTWKTVEHHTASFWSRHNVQMEHEKTE
jgi:hypothetical protein